MSQRCFSPYSGACSSGVGVGENAHSHLISGGCLLDHCCGSLVGQDKRIFISNNVMKSKLNKNYSEDRKGMIKEKIKV